MIELDWPADLVPYSVTFYLQPHTGGSESPFSRARKTYGLSAPRWICRMSFRGGDSTKWGTANHALLGQRMDALIARLKGGQNKIRIHDFRRDFVTGSAADGSASNLAASRGATSMTFEDAEPLALFMSRGDYLGGDGRVHMAVRDVVADLSGNAVVEFEPPLAAAIAAGQAELGDPTSLFQLMSDDAGANASPVGELTAYELAFVEDLTWLAGDTGSAADLLEGETQGLAIDGATRITGSAVCVRDTGTPANNFSGSIRRWLTAAGLTSIFPAARTVTFADGTTGSSDPDDVPYDFTGGEQALLIDADDNFELPSSKFPAIKSVYIELEVSNVGSAVTQTPIDLYDSNNGAETMFFERVAAGAPAYWNVTTYADGANSSAVAGVEQDAAPRGIVSFAIRIEDNANAISMNGEAPLVDPRRGGPTANRIKLGGNFNNAPNHRIRLRKLIALPRLLSDSELAAWQGASRRLHPHVVTAEVVCRHGAHSGATRAREPVMVPLGETGDISSFLVFHMQKYGEDGDGHHIEAPARLMQRFYQFDRSSGRLRSDTATSVVFQQGSGWSSGLGHMQSPIGYKRLYGPNKGKLFMLWSELVSANQTFSPTEERDIRMAWSAANGQPGSYSSPVTVVSGAAFDDDYLIPGPNGNAVQFGPGSAYPNRVAIVAYDGAGPRILFTDDDSNWSVGAAVSGSPGTHWANESTLALLPDGRLVVTSRLYAGGDVNNLRHWFLSDDGGATLEYQGALPGFEGAAVNGSTIQLDPAGATGDFGRVASSAANYTSGIPRHGCRIEVRGEDMALVSAFQAVARFRELGYNDIMPLFDGEFLALAQEGSQGGFNNKSSVLLSILKTPRLPS